MEEAPADLKDHLPELDWVDIRERAKAGPIVLTDLDAVPEPRDLRRLKAAIRDRWGTVPLLDMLTETALRTGCLDAFGPVGNRSELAAATLFQRLLLTVYAYGTNTGIRAVAAADHGHGEDELRYVRRRYMTVQSCQQAARVIANATFAARQAWLWGEGSTAVASDSTHFRAWDQNIFTEWHSRYRNGKRGVLICWTVERGGAMAVHSQLLECSASEVHAMVEGATLHRLRHSRLTHLGDQNVSAPLLMAVSGHRQLATLQQYVKPSQAAVAKLMADTDPDRRHR